MNNRLHQKNVTMDDIALELGISKSTVSRALSRSSRISVETIEKVNDCAQRLGFKPNLVAKALAGQKTLNIAAVLPAEAYGVQMMFFHECLNGIVEKAEQSGYSVLVCLTSDKDNEPLADILNFRKVDAVILTQVKRNDKNIALLKEYDIPFAVIGMTDKNIPQIDSKMTENCSVFTQQCVSKLNQKNKVLFVCGSLEVEVNHSRLAGFFNGMELSCKQSQKGESIQYSVCTDIEGLRENVDLTEWNLILCSDDVICVEILKLLKQKKLEAGTDIKLASFHDSILLESVSPAVTALKIDAASLGNKACEVVINILSDNEYQMVNYVDCSTMNRETV